MEEEKQIAERLRQLVAEHLSKHHGTGAVKEWMLSLKWIKLEVYTDATRPGPATLPAGTVIYSSTDGGLIVTDGTNWKAPEGGWVVT